MGFLGVCKMSASLVDGETRNVCTGCAYVPRCSGFQVAGTMETPSPRHRKELPDAVGYHHHIHTAFKKKKKKLINKLPRLYTTTTTPLPLQPLTSRDDLNYTFAMYACIAFLVLTKIHLYLIKYIIIR